MRPKVINLFTRMGAGGPPIQAALLARELPRCGFQSIVAAGSCEEGESEVLYLLDSRNQFRSIPHLARSVSFTRDIQSLWSLYRFFRQERPDIVHTHTAKAGVLGRLAAKAARVPAIVHTYHGNVFASYFSGPVNILIRMVERTLALITDQIYVLSAQQKEDVVSRHRIANCSRVSVVPLGLDLSEFSALPPPDRTNDLVVGWLGRLVPIKDIPLLCEVVRHCVRNMPNVRFIIAGDGPERDLVLALTREVGESRCSFVGWQRDVVPVIAKCHLIMQTSKNEGTPVALIQGLAAGRPFISTAAGGVVDMATGIERQSPLGVRWGGNAVLVSPRPEAFAEAIAGFERNPDLLAAMSEQARLCAKSYSLDSFLMSLKHLYNGLLASSGTTMNSDVRSNEASAGLVK